MNRHSRSDGAAGAWEVVADAGAAVGDVAMTAACAAGYRDLGYISGLLERHGVADAHMLACALAVPTVGRPLDLAGCVAAMMRQLRDVTSDVILESGPTWFRLRAPRRGYLLLVDAGNAVIWLSCGQPPADGSVNSGEATAAAAGPRTGVLCFIGPQGAAARILCTIIAGSSRLEVVGGSRFKACCRSMLLRQIDIEVVLGELMRSPFHGDPAIAATAIDTIVVPAALQRATDIARERGFVEIGTPLFRTEPPGDIDIAQTMRHLYRVQAAAGG